MLIINIVLFCLLFYSFNCQEKGESCTVRGLPGTCKIIHECEFARRVVRVEKKKPQKCFGEDDVEIVCCPVDNQLHRTGVFRDYFLDTSDGVKRSRDMTCRYNGKQPITCCGNIFSIPPPPEPANCPPIQRPALPNSAVHVAWEKCLDYQRYLQVCVAKKDNPNNYERKNACGIPKDTYRISSGVPAGPKQFPHMALLGCQIDIPTADEDILWIGGGSLISDKFILTAGHVLQHLRHGLVQFAMLGSLSRSAVQNGSIYSIDRIIPYPTYSPSAKNDDLALLELDRQVLLSEFVRPACLPVPGLSYEYNLIIAGWGEVDEKSRNTDILKTAEVTQVDGSICRETLQLEGFKWNSETMMCAAGILDSESGVHTDSCRGDSGGPLMSVISESIIPCTYSVRGIVSFGPNCGKGNPGVYTNVAFEPYINWIVDNVWPKQN